MPSYVTPKRATEYIFYISLVSQANTKIFQANPTIAAGDFKVSIDGGAEANLATLPAVTPASSKRVKITLSIAEMTGDNITVTCSDASGAEWCDLTINIQTSLRQIDDLATLAWPAAWDAEVQSEVQDAIEANNLDHLAGTAASIPAIPAGTYIDQMMDDGTAVYDRTTDSLQAIRDRGDAAWTTGAGGSNPEVLITTTITNLISQQLFDLTDGSADDNAYNGMTVVITDASNPDQKCVSEVLTHAGAGPTISLKEDPAIFTIANGDTISILADRSLKPNVHGRMLDLTTGGAAGIDWGNMENKTTTNALTGTTVGTATNLTNAPTAGDLTAAMKASVNAEVVDALNVDTYAEIGQETPAATQTIRKMIAYLYKAFRNRKTQTATTLSLYADDATTVDQKATISDDGTTYSHGEIGTGP